MSAAAGSLAAPVTPDGPRNCVLDVDRSVTGRRWQSRNGDERTGLMLAQRLGVPELVGRLLAARGVAVDEAAVFLAPRLREALPDPSRLAGMDDGVARLVAAIAGREPIAVFGDYDVDGATSAALLARFFAGVGVPIRTYIPDRMSEGYGPNTGALLQLRAEGVNVVVTVDCGITAFEPLAAAAQAGLDVIVVDHHVAEPKLPAAAAVINPNRLDDTSGLGQLAAVGVTFLLVVALNRALRAAGHYADRPEPDLLAFLDLVALGTVCDVVPLVGINRALVAQGLKVMARRRNAGLAALADVVNIHEPPTAYHAGFLLGPRVNAGGRVGESGLGAQLLTTRDAGEAAALAARLDAYNEERRAIEAEVQAAATAQIEGAGAGPRALVFAVGEGWHPGVIGIVAGRLKDRYNLPALVVALADGTGKGSARSVAGLDLGAIVIAARQAGLLINGGGHRMAAGLTVAGGRLEALRAFLETRIADEIRAQAIVPTLAVDGIATAPGVTAPDFVAAFERLAPFGAGNPQPRFAFAALRVARADIVGGAHVRCVLTDAGGARLNAIAFRAAGGPLGRALQETGGLPLHVAGTVKADDWQGRTRVQLIIDDAAPI